MAFGIGYDVVNEAIALENAEKAEKENDDECQVEIYSERRAMSNSQVQNMSQQVQIKSSEAGHGSGTRYNFAGPTFNSCTFKL